MSNYLRPNTGVTITVAASDKLATWSLGDYSVDQTVGYPNLPETTDNLFTGSGANTTSAFSSATSVTIKAGEQGLWYETGTGPVIPEQYGLARTQGDPGALNATGTITAALLFGGIITSTTASGVTATLATGAAMGAATNMGIGDAVEWSAINTGDTNDFTVTASSGHTLVGNGVVQEEASGRFLTRCTAANTFVTYRLA
jgi:hypothetical protein